MILFDSIRRLPGREDEKVALDKLEAFIMPRDGGFEGTFVLELRNKAYITFNCQRQRLIQFYFSLVLIVDFLRNTRYGRAQHYGGERAERGHDM